MSEERIGGGTGASQLFLMIGMVAGIILLLGAIWCTLFSFVPDPNSEKTTNLTIEYLWEEDSKYYFADSEGVVYKMGRPQGQVMYETMPKTRFAKLKEGGNIKLNIVVIGMYGFQ